MLCVDSESGIDTSSGSATLRFLQKRAGVSRNILNYTDICRHMGRIPVVPVGRPGIGPLSRGPRHRLRPLSRVRKKAAPILPRIADFGPNLHLAATGLQRAQIETSTPPFCSILCVDSESSIDTSSGSAHFRFSAKMCTWVYLYRNR